VPTRPSKPTKIFPSEFIAVPVVLFLADGLPSCVAAAVRRQRQVLEWPLKYGNRRGRAVTWVTTLITVA
jgi:hypothetical protein